LFFGAFSYLRGSSPIGANRITKKRINTVWCEKKIGRREGFVGAGVLDGREVQVSTANCALGQPRFNKSKPYRLKEKKRTRCDNEGIRGGGSMQERQNGQDGFHVHSISFSSFLSSDLIAER